MSARSGSSANSAYSIRRKAALDSGNVKRARRIRKPAELLSHSLQALVMAHVLPEDQYKREFNDFEKFHIDRSLEMEVSKEWYNKPTRTVGVAEEVLLESVMDSMIKEILEHPDISKAVEEVVNEPAPYFAQMISSPAHRYVQR
jgi:hypothetical protein